MKGKFHLYQNAMIEMLKKFTKVIELNLSL